MTMAFWKIAPALIMGNTVVLKPASVTSLSALIIAEAAKAAGIPDGVLNVIAGPGAQLGEVLCTHRDVGVPEESLPVCAFHAVVDTAVIFNGRPVVDPNEVLEVFTQAY